MAETGFHFFAGLHSFIVSEDGLNILFTSESAEGSAKFGMTVEEVPQTIAALSAAACVAYSNSRQAQDLSKMLAVHAIQLIESRTPSDLAALNVVLEPNGPSIPFVVSKQTLERIAEDLLERFAPQKLTRSSSGRFTRSPLLQRKI